MFHRILDRLEEWLILSFMAAATLVTFVSVMMRYLMGTGFTWATELTIYLFIWMAKFGAAYGVRTGIHVGVDYVVNSTGRVRQENFDAELQLALDRRFGLFEVKATGVAETAEAVLGLVAKGVRRVVLRRPEIVLEEFGKQLEAAAAPPELTTGA